VRENRNISLLPSEPYQKDALRSKAGVRKYVDAQGTESPKIPKPSEVRRFTLL